MNRFLGGRSEFDFLADNGVFVFFWHSNNHKYGISKRVLNDIDCGKHVVVNGSREYYEKALEIYPDIVSILITAPDEVCVQRLLRRGRED